MVFCVAGANRIDPARSVIWAGPVFPSGRMPESARTNVNSSNLQPKPLSTTPGPWRRLALILVLLGGSALIVWTSLGRWELPAIGSRQPDYYNLLVSGFRKGSLALDIDVPQQVKDAKSPQELMKVAPDLAPHDLSYFKGHYYMYYGVVPAVVMFWPFRVLTGHDLPLVLGFLAFAIGAFALLAALWLRIVGDHFPRAGWATRVGGMAALCLAGGQLVLARRVSLWEPSIQAGNFFLVCMMASGYHALRARRPLPWLAVAGLALGLATGSRPTLVVAGLGLIPLLAAIGPTCAPGPGRSAARGVARAALAAGAPLAAIGFCLLAYNWARFGNPLELGLKYQFSTWNDLKRSHFLAAFIPFNSFLYFLAQPQWGRYFPFVHPIAYPSLPSGYYGYEYVYGALVICPVLWWGAFLPLLARRGAPELRSFIACVFAAAVPTTLVLLCFDTSAARYETDFLPWWVLLALLGWALLEDRMRSGNRAVVVALARSLFVASAAFSCVVAFCCSAELHEILQTLNPGAYRGISRVFNAPTALWERLSGYAGGAIEMNLTFAKRPIESVEPLVVTGVEYQRDYVYLYYQRDTVVRFCYVHPGEPVASSADVTVEPGRSYPFRVECGALYPPEGHLAYHGWQPEELDSYKRWVRINFNGRTVVIAPRGSNEASPGSVQIGVDSGNGYCGRRFAGTISEVRRAGWTRPLGDCTPTGDFDLVMALPGKPTVLNSPLVTAGTPGKADILGLNVDGAGLYRLYYESWGLGIWNSGDLEPPKDGVLTLRMRVGPTLPLGGRTPLAAMERSIVVWSDGKPVWWRRTAAPIAANPPVGLLTNAVGSSTVGPVFQGRVISADRRPFSPEWRRGAFSALKLELGGRGEGCEPLVATGVTGRSDTLEVDWLGNGRAQLVYDHWGVGAVESEPFAWPDSEVRSVRVEMPSFGVLDQAGEPAGRGRLAVWVDGAKVWSTDVAFFGAASDTVSVGENASGCTTAGPELRSVIIDAAQVSRE